MTLFTQLITDLINRSRTCSDNHRERRKVLEPPSESVGISPKEAMNIPHLAPDTAPIPQAFSAQVATPELLLLEVLASRKSRSLHPVILTCALTGVGS